MIDQSEFKAPPHRGHNRAGGILSRADTDNDGNISRDELDSMKTKIKEQVIANLERRVEDLDSMFIAADADNDKLVSAEELRLLAFQKMDSNADGFISVEEMRKPERPIMDQRSQRAGKPHLKHRPDMESE
jgi:Ca2+-binding EF-hand superfamily protein